MSDSMSEYSPDRWQVVSLVNEEGERIDKVFGSWYGGYGGSDSWKLSSGITKVVEHDKYYEVHNVSGSIYECYKGSEGMSMYAYGIFKRFEAKQEEGKYTITKIDIKEVRQLT
jgi:hypothetical protein